MTSYGSFRSKPNLYSLFTPSFPISFAHIVEGWSTEQAIQWLKGVDDSLSGLLELFARRQVDGRALLLMDEDSLDHLGILSLGVRRIILQAVELLRHYCYSMEKENLQSLCLKTSVQAHNLINEMRTVASRWHLQCSRRDLVALQIAIYTSVSVTLEQLKGLLCWLDRSPFDRLSVYIGFRDTVMSLTLSLSEAVCIPTKELVRSAPQLIIETCEEVVSKCEEVVLYSDDPLVLYTAYLERTFLRKGKSSDWGINLQSSYRGIHVISEVKLHSPADSCGKVDAGDELLQINGETVIGWKLSNVARRFAFDGSEGPTTELMLMVKKRPREAVIAPLVVRRQAPAETVVGNRSVLKIAPGSEQSTIIEDRLEQFNHFLAKEKFYLSGTALRRTASLELLSSVPEETSVADMSRLHVDEKEMHRTRSPTVASSRRASVSCGTPPAESHHYREDVAVEEQLECPVERPISDAVCAQRRVSIEHGRHRSAIEDISEIAVEAVVRRRRTMRQQPGGYVRSFIDNCRLVCELDDENGKPICSHRTDDDEDVFVSSESQPVEESCPEPDAYAVIDVIENGELEALGLPSLNMDEWSSALDLSLPTIEECPSEYGSLPTPALSTDEPAGGRCGGGRTASADSNGRFDGSLSKLSSSGIHKLRRFFSSSFRSRSHAPIAESEESSLGWESDAGSEGSFPQAQLSESYGSSVDPGDSGFSGKETSWNALRELARVPCACLNRKQHEGWIRRKRMDFDVCSGGKWIKCWMVLRSSVLYIYHNRAAREADFVIAVAKFMVSDAPDLRTSKKHVFRLYRRSLVFYFCAYSSKEMKEWMNKLGLATICYDQTEDERKNSDALSRSMLYISWLEDSEQSPACSPTSSGHHTLPRAKLATPDTHRCAYTMRQNSLSSFCSAVQTSVPVAPTPEVPPSKLPSLDFPHSIDGRRS